MTHDPNHDRGAQEQVPWELRGASGSRNRPSTGPRSGPSTTTRVIIALVLVAALIVPLIGRW